jgi:hypothetical protein
MNCKLEFYNIFSFHFNDGIVSRYSDRLRAGRRRGRSSSPTRVKDFPFLHVVRTSYEAHPACYPVGTGGSFPGGKAAGT